MPESQPHSGTAASLGSPPLSLRAYGLLHATLRHFSSVWVKLASRQEWQEIGIYDLPFGLLLKWTHKTDQQEAQATRFARAAGIPVPRVISYGEWKGQGSILMTRMEGVNLGWVWSELNSDQISQVQDDLRDMLRKLRSVPSPLGSRICGFNGQKLRSHRLSPDLRMGSWETESAWLEAILETSPINFSDYDTKRAEILGIAARRHRIVFTHGDLLPHNIFVDENCKVVGIIDWEMAGWLPEWWEFAASMRVPNTWSDLMHEIGGKDYQWELAKDRHLLMISAGTFGQR